MRSSGPLRRQLRSQVGALIEDGQIYDYSIAATVSGCQGRRRATYKPDVTVNDGRRCCRLTRLLAFRTNVKVPSA